jgi:hypothetical protein
MPGATERAWPDKKKTRGEPRVLLKSWIVGEGSGAILHSGLCVLLQEIPDVDSQAL